MARFTRPLPTLVLALVITACSKNSYSPNPPPPAPPPPPPPPSFSCLGQPLPTTAANSVVVSGVVQSNLANLTALAGAQVDAYRTGNATALGTTTSAANGSYTLTLATGGAPLDGYVRVTKATYRDTYAYPPAPLVVNATQSLYLLTTAEFNLLASVAGITPVAGSGAIAVVVSDCNGTAVAGATVSTTPSSTVRYASGGVPSTTATATAADGVAYVFNVAAGDVVVRADSGTKTLRAHTVNARADAVTITVVAPGPH